MKDKKTIIIFYSKGIYDTNALLIADKIQSLGKDCHIIAIGDDEYTNLGSGTLARQGYIFSMRNARWMYGLYSMVTSKKSKKAKPLKNIKPDKTELTGFNKLYYNMTCWMRKIKNILRRYDPEVVLCYTPKSLNAAIKAKEQLRMYNTRIFACLTDFGLDTRFINKRSSGYFVQNNDVKKELTNLGIDNDKIFVTSILSNTTVEYDKEEIRREIGIRNDKPCIMLVGGRYGNGIIKNAMNKLVDYTDNFNLIVMSGGSDTIVNVAKKLAERSFGSVFVINKIDDIAKIYNIADIVVATPTTCICTESFVYGKPLVLLKGVGNVEEYNIKFLVSRNYAYDGSTSRKLIDSVSDIMINGSKCIDIMNNMNLSISVDEVAEGMKDIADRIFEEKKIVLAEKELGNARDISDYLVEELPSIESHKGTDNN